MSDKSDDESGNESGDENMEEQTQLLSETVEELVRQGAAEDLSGVLAAQPAADLADLLEHAEPEVRDALFAALEAHRAGEVAALLDDPVREEVLEDVSPLRLAEMVVELDSDDAVSVLEDAAPELTVAVLEQLPPEDATELRELLAYDEETAGRVMAYGAPAVTADMTLGEVIGDLRATAPSLGELQAVYVVDDVGRLQGYLPLDVLLLQPPAMRVEQVMRREYPFAYTYEDQETAAARARRARVPVIPIIDSHGVLRGQIMQERLRAILEEENSEDMYRMVGLAEDESVHSSFGTAWRKRLPWLFVNLWTALIAAWVVSRFEGLLAQLAVLAVLQSVVPGQGGNAGIQTLTITVRGLALGDLDWRNCRRVFWKEFRLGAANGVAIGLTTALLVWLWRGNPWLGVVIGGAMLLNMLAAAVAGFSIPLLLRFLKLDPAQASGVFVTTVTDVCGFFFFLGLASLLMPLLR